MAPALRRCVGVDTSTFARHHWSRRPLLSRATALPGPFGDLLSPGDVDELLAVRGQRTPFFRVVRDGATVDPVRYTRSAGVGPRRVGDLADADRIFELYGAGATIVLQALHRTWPPVAAFCRALAADLGHPTQANAYVTPPGSRGFAPHHDTHDVFVLQVDGHKRWQVYEPVLSLPLRRQPSADHVGAGGRLLPQDAAPLLSVVLSAGDALYLPRGYVHAAETSEDRSVHLTVGVLALTWYDVLQDVLAQAADEPAFRQALPLGVDAGDPDGGLAAEMAAFLSRAAGWLGRREPDTLLAPLRARLARAMPPEPVRVLAQTDAARHLSPGTPLRVRRGLAWSLSAPPGTGRLVLRLPDRDVAMPGLVEPALRRALAGAPVSAAGLAPFPAEDGIVLLRRLLREGVLVPAGADGAGKVTPPAP
ncbi:MAG TPA: cupin domain-containing protein [Frankiaceae bacterium]|nr:cupin domain-containing protein [Frankiaceae bacterium]